MAGRAFIVAATRTATGKKGGWLSHTHSADLGAAVVDALVQKRVACDPALVDDGECRCATLQERPLPIGGLCQNPEICISQSCWI